MSHQDNPFETPSPKGIRVVQATLRVVTAIQCWGYSAAHLHQKQDYLFLDMLQSGYDLPMDQMAQFNDYAAYFLAATGFICLFRPIWVLLIPLIVWQTGMAVAVVIMEQGPLPYVEVALQSVRFLVPLALLLVDFWPPRVKPTLAFCVFSIGMLRLATAVTFVAHGLLSLYEFQNGGETIELLTTAASRLFQKTIDQDQAQLALAGIGVFDIAIAAALLSSRNRFVAFCLVIWGLATAAIFAFSRGLAGYHESLIRVAHAGVPLTILIFWLTAIREQQPIVLPDED